MKIELTSDKKEWISMKNDIFHEGDIIITHEKIERKDLGMVLAEVGDELIVVGADCIGCFVQNKSRPELNFKVPPNVPKDEHWMYDCWHCFCTEATLIKKIEG